MTDLVFVDTNVLIYRIDATEPAKQIAATEWLDVLWREQCARLSWQVLAEFYNNVVRKLAGVTDDAARAMVRMYSELRPIPHGIAVFQRAWALQDRYSLSWWDALIVGAASVAGCRYLLTEDMQHGQELDGVTLVSPFLSSPAEILTG